MIKIEKVTPTAKIEVQHKDGSIVTKHEQVAPPTIVTPSMANVGMKLGTTINTGNYESVRVDVSLFMPSETSAEQLNDTFEAVSQWVDDKLAKMVEEIRGGSTNG